MEAKRCKGCGVLSTHENTWTYLNGRLQSYCKDCDKKRTYAKRAKNPAQQREINRVSSLKNKYNMTIEEWDFMFLKQGKKCAICRCGEEGLTKSGWHLDHCHVSKVNRGILCHHCNLMLGNAKDNTTNLRNGIKYLECNQWAAE